MIQLHAPRAWIFIDLGHRRHYLWEARRREKGDADRVMVNGNVEGAGRRGAHAK